MISKTLATHYQAVGAAFAACVSQSIDEGAEGIADAFRASDLSDERVDWIDGQLTVILRLILPVVRDPAFPDWLLPCRPAIENAFEP